MDECMHYAVENSPKVKKQTHTSDSYKAELNSAVASFFPSMSASVGAQYSFGRSIDPETNVYNNTSTFNNGYGLSVSIPIFNGGQLINQWRMAKANRQLGMNDIQKEKDDLAINTMQAFMDVVYYQGTVKLAAEQLEENSRILYKTCLLYTSIIKFIFQLLLNDRFIFQVPFAALYHFRVEKDVYKRQLKRGAVYSKTVSR